MRDLGTHAPGLNRVHPRHHPRRATRALGLAAAGVLSAVSWGFIEARRFQTRSVTVPILPPGWKRATILHISDLHLDSHGRLSEYVAGLARRQWDMVVATGDLLGSPAGVDALIDCLGGFRSRLGNFFVLGSSDYYAPIFKNYVSYFLKSKNIGTRRNRTDALLKGLLEAGWNDLTNSGVTLEDSGHYIQLVGMDDPHLRREDLSVLVRDSRAGLAICVVHDPKLFEDIARSGFDLILSGHTHGGQVRLPFIGALVTNSTLPRRLARGLHQVGRSWLHVTPGLGTGRYAPFRFLCPPEASILELVSPATR